MIKTSLQVASQINKEQCDIWISEVSGRRKIVRESGMSIYLTLSLKMYGYGRLEWF